MAARITNRGTKKYLERNMNCFLINLIVLLFSCCITEVTLAQQNLIPLTDYGTNPGNLKAFVHVPINSSNAPKPLVVVLHGCTQNAKSIAEQSGWNKLADEYGFYVLYPQQKFLNNPQGCFDWFLQNDITKDNGEVYSIKQMINEVQKKYVIDTTKIFAYGLSAGALMSVALLANYPQLFNAGAILAGGPFVPSANPLNSLKTMLSPSGYTANELKEYVHAQNPTYAKPYPRLVVLHGKNDLVVNIKNSYTLINQWTALHNIDSLPTTTYSAFNNQANITKYKYGNAVCFYEVNNLGHTLMIDPGNGPIQGGAVGTFAADKDFFSTYWIALDFGLINK